MGKLNTVKNGKGPQPRKYDVSAYNEGFDRIFRKPAPPEPEPPIEDLEPAHKLALELGHRFLENGQCEQ